MGDVCGREGGGVDDVEGVGEGKESVKLSADHFKFLSGLRQQGFLQLDSPELVKAL